MSIKKIMKIYSLKKFKLYLNQPVRIKNMGNRFAAIGGGALLATFTTMSELRTYFPFGTHKKIK
jgi:hypothetical protein